MFIYKICTFKKIEIYLLLSNKELSPSLVDGNQLITGHPTSLVRIQQAPLKITPKGDYIDELFYLIDRKE